MAREANVDRDMLKLEEEEDPNEISHVKIAMVEYKKISWSAPSL